MKSARVSRNPTEFNEINCNCYGIHLNFIESVGFLWNLIGFYGIEMIAIESI